MEAFRLGCSAAGFARLGFLLGAGVAREQGDVARAQRAARATRAQGRQLLLVLMRGGDRLLYTTGEKCC